MNSLQWQNFLKQERMKMVFEYDEMLRNFLLSSNLHQVTYKDGDIVLFEIEHEKKLYRFVQTKGKWNGYPSNAFVQYGMRLAKLCPFFTKFLEQEKEPTS